MNFETEVLMKGLVMTGLMNLEQVFDGHHKYSQRGILASYEGYGPTYSKEMQDSAKADFPAWDNVFDIIEDLGVDLDEERDYYERIKHSDAQRWKFLSSGGDRQ